MKNSITILAFLFISFSSSCKSNIASGNNENNILGNWYLSRNTITTEFDYQEIYIDGHTISVFTPSNYAISSVQDYTQNQSYIYYLDKDKIDTLSKMEIEKRGELLILKNDNGLIEYRRVEDERTLSDYIYDEISKEDFDDAFTKRMKKSGNGERFLRPDFN